MDSSLDLDFVVRLVLEQALSALGGAGAVLCLRDGEELVCRGSVGKLAVAIGIRVPIQGSLSGRCLVEDVPLVSADSESDPRSAPHLRQIVEVRSALIHPVHLRGGAGVLAVLSPERGRFQLADGPLLAPLAGLLGKLLDGPAATSTLSPLQRSDERFRAFMDNGPAVAWMKDANGRYLYSNALADRLYGLQGAGLLGLRDKDFLPPEVAEMLEVNDRKVLEGGKPLETVEEVRSPDGTQRTFLSCKFPLESEGARITGGVAIEITERRRMERELEDDVQRLEFIIDTQREMSMLDLDAEELTQLALDRTQTITGASGLAFQTVEGDDLVFAHVTGSLSGKKGMRFQRHTSLAGRCLVRGELLYCPDTESDPRVSAAAVKASAARSVAVVPIYAENKIVGVLTAISLEVDAFCPGDLRALQLMAALVGSALIRLVTQNARAQVAQANSRLAVIVEASRDAIYGLDAQGIVTSWNGGAERLFGTTAEETLGTRIRRFVPEEGVDECQALLARLLSGEAVSEQETVRRRADGTRIEISISFSPVRDASGVVGIACIARDATDRKRADRQLRASLREKEVLLHEIHHRVKNNLQVISSLLGMQAKNAEGRSIGELIRESQQRVRSIAIFHDKLYRSKNLGDIDIGDYLGELAKGVVRAHGVDGRVRIELLVDKTSFGVDRALPCGLIVNELVTNAVKHAFPERKGAVEVSLRERDGRVTLRVSDDGIGLPEGVNPETSRGAGMQIVATLAQQLGGDLCISRSPGAHFSVSFPAKIAEA